jgi:hypothetical protein
VWAEAHLLLNVSCFCGVGDRVGLHGAEAIRTVQV